MLKQPSNALSADLKTQRLVAQDQDAIAEYEELVTSWMTTIDAVLTENTNDRLELSLYCYRVSIAVYCVLCILLKKYSLISVLCNCRV
jgi:hypothetical protein